MQQVINVDLTGLMLRANALFDEPQVLVARLVGSVGDENLL